MFKFYRISKFSQDKQEKSKRSLLEGIKVNSFIISLIIVGLIVISGTLYLVQVNYVATKGYQIRDFEQKINTLKDQNKKLSVEIIKLQSSVELEKKIRELSMVRVNQFDYLTRSDNAVAVATP